MFTLRSIIALAALAGAALGIAILPAPSADAGEDLGIAIADARKDIGTGETLAVLLAGEYDTFDKALAVNNRTDFDDLQGFVVARSDDFQGLPPGRWLLVTAFRTLAGADAFEPLARATGLTIRREIARYTGLIWIGLGQEPHPDGSGPLNGPLPSGHPARLELP